MFGCIAACLFVTSLNVILEYGVQGASESEGEASPSRKRARTEPAPGESAAAGALPGASERRSKRRLEPTTKVLDAASQARMTPQVTRMVMLPLLSACSALRWCKP